MTDINILRAEVAHMTDRDLLLEIIKGQRLQNGAIAKHAGDLYGDPERGIKGVRPLVDAHEIAIDRTRVRFQTVVGLVLFIGAGNLIALLTLIK